MKLADDLFAHMNNHWQLWLGIGSTVIIATAFLLAGSSVQVVQYIISAKSPSITQYVACETGATIDLPALRIVDDEKEVAVSDVSTLSVEPGVTLRHQRTGQGFSIRIIRGIGGLIDNGKSAGSLARLVSHPGNGDEIIDLDIGYSGTQLLIDGSNFPLTVKGEGILEIGGANDATGLAVPLSDKAVVSAVDTPILGAERIKFVDVEIEPYSIIFTHPELITEDRSEESSGGLTKSYAVLKQDACLANDPRKAQAVASFAFRISPDEPGDTDGLMDVNVIRKSNAVGLVTMGEVVPLQGLPKLIQVSTWSRVVSSPALQAAFATAAALVGLFSMFASLSDIKGGRKKNAPNPLPANTSKKGSK